MSKTINIIYPCLLLLFAPRALSAADYIAPASSNGTITSIGAGYNATLTNTQNSDTGCITVSGTVSLGNMTIGDSSGTGFYTLSGGNLNFDNNGNNSILTHAANSQAGDTIASNLTLNTNDLEIRLLSTNDLTISGTISGSKNLTISGPGNLSLHTIRATPNTLKNISITGSNITLENYHLNYGLLIGSGNTLLMTGGNLTNTAINGVGISNNGDTTLDNLVTFNNTASASATGFYNTGNLSLSNIGSIINTVSTSTATGFYNSGNIIIQNITSISSSSPSSGPVFGNAFRSSGSASKITFDNSTATFARTNIFNDSGRLIVQNNTTLSLGENATLHNHNLGSISGDSGIKLNASTAKLDSGGATISTAISLANKPTVASTNGIAGGHGATTTFTTIQTWGDFTYDWTLGNLAPSATNNNSRLNFTGGSSLTLSGTAYTLNILAATDPVGTFTLGRNSQWSLITGTSFTTVASLWTIANPATLFSTLSITNPSQYTLALNGNSTGLYLNLTFDGNYTWNTTSTGLWSDTANWEHNTGPGFNAPGSTIHLIRNQTPGTGAITIDQTTATIGNLIIGSDTGNHIISSGTLNFDNNGSNSTLTHLANAQAGDTIASNLTLNSNPLEIRLLSPKALTISGTISGTNLTITGPGNLTLNTTSASAGGYHIDLNSFSATDAHIIHNHASSGTGIAIANFTITGGSFTNNISKGNGIASHTNKNNLILTDTQFYNFANDSGVTAINIYEGQLTVTGGNFTNNVVRGYGIYTNNSSISISNVENFINESYGNGGGTAISAANATLSIANTNFFNNVTATGGFHYGIASSSDIRITDSHTVQNISNAVGIDFTKTLTITNGTFTNNVSNGGTGILPYGASLAINNVTFTNDVSKGSGIRTVLGEFTLTHGTFINNVTGGTGIHYQTSGNTTFTNLKFINNVTGSSATGIQVASNTFKIIDTQFDNNVSAGTGISIGSTPVTITGNKFVNNVTATTSTTYGISLSGSSASLLITNTDFHNDYNGTTSTTYGLYDYSGAITINQDAATTFTNNANGPSGYAINSSGTLSINGGTFTNNVTNRSGINTSGTLSITDTRFINNVTNAATGISHSGGYGRYATLTNLTLTQNLLAGTTGINNTANFIITQTRHDATTDGTSINVINNTANFTINGASSTFNATITGTSSNAINNSGASFTINDSATLNATVNAANSNIIYNTRNLTLATGASANLTSTTASANTILNTGTTARLTIDATSHLQNTGTIRNINGATLQVDGTLTGGDILMSGSNVIRPVIAGTGTITANITGAHYARISPGNSTQQIGTLNIIGTQDWTAGMGITWQAGSLTDNTPTSNDLIAITGALDLASTARYEIDLSSALVAINTDYSLVTPWTLLTTTEGINNFTRPAWTLNNQYTFLATIGLRGTLRLNTDDTSHNLLLHLIPNQYYWNANINNGLWSNETNWETAPGFNAPGDTIHFTRDQSSTGGTVNVNGDATVGNIIIGSENGTSTSYFHTLSGGNIIFNANGTTSNLTHLATAQAGDTIRSNIQINTNDLVIHALSANTLTLNGTITGTQNLTFTGGGNITLNTSSQNQINVANITLNGTTTLTVNTARTVSATAINNTATITLDDNSSLILNGNRHATSIANQDSSTINLLGTSTLSANNTTITSTRSTAGNSIYISPYATLALNNTTLSQTITAGYGIFSQSSASLQLTDSTLINTIGASTGNGTFLAGGMTLKNSTIINTIENPSTLRTGIQTTGAITLQENSRILNDGQIQALAGIQITGANVTIAGNGLYATSITGTTSTTRLSPGGSYNPVNGAITHTTGHLLTNRAQTWAAFTYDWQMGSFTDNSTNNNDWLAGTSTITLSGLATAYTFNLTTTTGTIAAADIADKTWSLLSSTQNLLGIDTTFLSTLNTSHTATFNNLLSTLGLTGKGNLAFDLANETIDSTSYQSLILKFEAIYGPYYWAANTPSNTYNGSSTTWEDNNLPPPNAPASNVYFIRDQNAAGLNHVNIDLAGTQTIGNLTIGSENGTTTNYTLSNGTLNFNNRGNTSLITHSAKANDDTISADITLQNDLLFHVASNAATANLTLTGNITATDRHITKTGAGTLSLHGTTDLRTGNITNSAGLLYLAHGSQTTTHTLTIAANAALQASNATLTGNLTLEHGAIITNQKRLGAKYNDRFTITGTSTFQGDSTFINLAQLSQVVNKYGDIPDRDNRVITDQTNTIYASAFNLQAGATYTINPYNSSTYDIQDWSIEKNDFGVYYSLLISDNISNFESTTWNFNLLDSNGDAWDARYWSIYKGEVGGIHGIWLHYSHPNRIPEPSTTALFVAAFALLATYLAKHRKK